MDSQYWRQPSASADEQDQHIPGVSSQTGASPVPTNAGAGPVPTNVGAGPAPTVVRPQGVSPGSERIEEPSYQEHGGNLSGQPTVEAPSFYPADLPDRQLQEWQANKDKHAETVEATARVAQSPYKLPQAQSQQRNDAYPSNQRQQAYGAVPPVPVSMPQQGSAPYAPYRQYPPNTPYAPYGQQYRSAPIPYTDPQAYQQPANGYAQQPQPPYPGYSYQGYYAPNGYQQSGYSAYPPGYPGYSYAWYLPRPRRNGYQLGMAITSLVGSILAILGGVLCGITLLPLTLMPLNTSTSTAAQRFAGIILVTSLMLAGVVGGGFGVFHSAVALAGRPSRPFKLPPFWSFLPLYIALVIVGLMVGSSDVIISDWPLAFSLIALSGILPALIFFALAVRRVRRPATGEWPTTWRRFTLALVSGATSAIFLALIFESILILIAGLQFSGVDTSVIDNPSAPTPHDLRTLIFMLTLVSVIAPIVEEGFKPLAVVILIGRIRSASEAFILGMACGIGFDMIETTTYIGQSYQGWVNVAIDRSTAGLLHGFGAGMMALGWYYITHKDALKRNHLQIGLGCMLYAILQHAIWNGSFVLTLLPAPIGPYLGSGKISIFTYQLDAFMIVYLLLSILILSFLWFVTGKVRLQPDAALRNNSKTDNQPRQAPAL